MCDVTVAICTYNRADMFREALTSVLDQTYRNIKVLVLDDCSTDDTEEVVRSFHDERIAYVRNSDNIGIFNNWNKAIRLCETEFLNIFHDDDRMYPWMIETLVGVFRANPTAGIVFSSNKNLMRDPNPYRPATIKQEIFRQDELIRYSVEQGRFNDKFSPPSFLFRKEALMQKNMLFRDDVGWSADTHFYLEANHKDIEMIYIDYPLLERRHHAQKATFAGDGAEKWFVSYKKTHDYLESLNVVNSMQPWRERAIGFVVQAVTFNNENPEAIETAQKMRARAKEAYGWQISDASFNDGVAIGYMGQYVRKLIEKRITLLQFLEKMGEVEQKGIKIPFKRKRRWLTQYYMKKRLLGM